MYPEKTFELRISFSIDPQQSNLKSQVIDWLEVNGVNTFVEGAVDDVLAMNRPDFDVDSLFETKGGNGLYLSVGGDGSPISIYRYDEMSLLLLKAALESSFGNLVKCQLVTSNTDDWREGWKKSFAPFTTDKFYIHPPWVKDPPPSGKLPIEIEPGMAFGTGQHATTVLCLKALEKLAISNAKWANLKLLDVGAGTGILAIGAKRLGAGKVVAGDIDPDAVKATRENIAVNKVEVEVFQGTFPDKQIEFDVIVANILAPIIIRLMPGFRQYLATEGYLVLSGILLEQAADVTQAAKAYGLEVIEQAERGDWCSIVLEAKES